MEGAGYGKNKRSVFLESLFSLKYFNSNLACSCPLFQYGMGKMQVVVVW